MAGGLTPGEKGAACGLEGVRRHALPRCNGRLRSRTGDGRRTAAGQAGPQRASLERGAAGQRTQARKDEPAELDRTGLYGNQRKRLRGKAVHRFDSAGGRGGTARAARSLLRGRGEHRGFDGGDAAAGAPGGGGGAAEEDGPRRGAAAAGSGSHLRLLRLHRERRFQRPRIRHRADSDFGLGQDLREDEAPADPGRQGRIAARLPPVTDNIGSAAELGRAQLGMEPVPACPRLRGCGRSLIRQGRAQLRGRDGDNSRTAPVADQPASGLRQARRRPQLLPPGAPEMA